MMKSKPIGQYEIDWSHPLTKGLFSCHLFGNTLFDNKSGILNKSSLDKPEFNKGGLHSSASSPQVTTGFLYPEEAENDISVFSRVKPYEIKTSLFAYECSSANTSDSLYNGFFLPPGEYYGREINIGLSNVGMDGWEYMFCRQIGKFAFYEDGFHSNSFLVPKLNTWQNVSGWYRWPEDSPYTRVDGHTKRLSTHSKYWDGIYPAQTAIVNAPLHTASNREFQGDIACIYTWDRVLSDEEFTSLEADPYVFLKPVKTIPSYYALARPCPDTNLITDVTKGTLVLNADGSFTYNYTAGNVPDTDYFEYSFIDDDGVSNTARVDLTIDQSIPISQDDDFSFSYNVTLNGNVYSDNGNGVDTYDCS